MSDYSKLSDEILHGERLPKPAKEILYTPAEVAELKAQVLDPELSKKFTYCAYCGHTESVDVDGEIIAAHIRTCEKHPLNIEIKQLKAQHEAAMERVFESHRQQVLLLMGDKDRLKAQCAMMLEKAATLVPHDDVSYAREQSRCEPQNCKRCRLEALIPTDHAAALAEVKRQVRREEAEWWSNVGYQHFHAFEADLHNCKLCQRIAALRAEGAKT